MKNIALLSILGLALLQPAVEAFFLGPIAVGAIIGALRAVQGWLGWILIMKWASLESRGLVGTFLESLTAVLCLGLPRGRHGGFGEFFFICFVVS